MEEDNKMVSKMSGYLEKKGKMKMMSSYKKYWFVLEGRLLLYYRSKDEYDAISPCKGSINLGPPCNIKSCPSSTGVFQIETRANTITLRAENREDQTRWMHGIMSALNQNKNSAKLSHFRYSYTELPQEEVVKEPLERQNTIPQRTGSPNIQKNTRIIQRLQKIGAQSYGGSIGTIHQIANNRKNENVNGSNSTENSVADLVTLRDTVLIENEQYGIIKRNSCTESIETRRTKPVEHIYERISTNSAEVNYSIPHKKIEYRDKSPSRKHQMANIDCENEDLNKDNRDTKNLDRPTTYLLENEAYGETKTFAIRTEKGNNSDRQNTMFLENDQYYSVDKRMRFPSDDLGVIYTESKTSRIIDHNENNLVLSNGKDWKKAEENAYSIIQLSDKNNLKMNSIVEYEDLDNYLEYTEPTYSPNEDIYAECSKKDKSKEKKQKKKKHGKDKTDDKKDAKLKKSSSFIKRVWKKKAKHKEKITDVDEEELYETVPATVVEKVSVIDGTAVQMLSELQNILENKKPILIDRISAAKSNKNINESTQYEEEIPSRVSDETVKMLSELQNILDIKKTHLTDRISTDKHSSVESSSAKIESQSTNENTIIEDVESASSSSGSEKIQPLLPPKNQKLDSCSPYHDFPRNNQHVSKVLPPKKRPIYDNVKSLDEILLDLDKEKCGNNKKNKVKKLIKQFSEPNFYENDVVLRTNKRSDYYREEIDSDELSRLLDELAKVTSAPILTPGATTSLISPILTDEELLKLLPARRRRYSEPDYDIPRSHKSLTNLPKRENLSDNVIGSTRFFGPILKPSDMNIRSTSEDLPQSSLSMTPDSLEPDLQTTKYIHHSHIPEDEKNSYTSHNYTSHNYLQLKNYTASNRNNEGRNKKRNSPTNFDNSIKHFDNIIIENDIYAQPKSLHGLHVMKGFKATNAGNHFCFKTGKNIDVELDDDRLQDEFVDSLEV